MIKKTHVFGFLQVSTIFVISVYVESVSGGKLLFLEKILNEELSKKIIESNLTVLIVLGGLNFLFYILSHKNKENKELRNMYNNICQLVFDKYIKPDTTLENSKFRVSLFKAKKGILLKRSKVFIPQYRTFLYNVGRYQTRQEKQYCKIKFLPNEGAVGISYSLGEILFEDTIRYSKENEKEYYKQQNEKLSMPNFKSKRIKEKPCSFICCPVKYFNSDNLFGVVVVDSIEPKELRKDEFRVIEDIIENYSVFFNYNMN